MSNQDIKHLARLSDEAKDMLDMVAANADLSVRAYMRTIKVSRTIADLEGSEDITPDHIAEAYSYHT